MMRSFSALVFSLVFVCIGVNLAYAQRFAKDSRNYFDFGDQYFYRAVASADGRSVDLQMNTASAVFSFQRSERPRDMARGGYYAIRDFTIEVMERGFMQSVLSKNIIDTIFERQFEGTINKGKWHALDETIALPKLDAGKKYSMRIEVRDVLLNKLAVRPSIIDIQPRTLEASAIDSNSIGIGDMILFDSLRFPMAVTKARGNDYDFSRDIICAVPIASFTKAEPVVDVIVRQITNLIDPADTGVRGQLTVSTSDMFADSLFRPVGADSQIYYQFVHNDSMPYVTTALFTIPGKRFDQGKYVFTVRASAHGVSRSKQNEFLLLWQGMPIALEDPAIAIAPMQHILTDDELKDMQTGTRAEQVQKLYRYWKKQDPTPETAYNERMASFFQRVDYTYFNYATGARLDGAMTDRGKVYILYGPPTNIDRTFLPGESPVETWIYRNNVMKTFKFLDRGGHGEYKLVEVKGITTP